MHSTHCNPSTRGGRAEGLEVQGHPQLCSELEASIDYVRLCLKQLKQHTIIALHKTILSKTE